MSTNLYVKILGIPASDREPNHYELLGLRLYESDPEAIHDAALARVKALKAWQLHPDPDIARSVQQLLNKVSHAEETLLNPVKRTQYDASISSDTPTVKIKRPVIDEAPSKPRLLFDRPMALSLDDSEREDVSDLETIAASRPELAY